MNKIVKRTLLALMATAALAASAQAGINIRIQPPTVRFESHNDRDGYVWQAGHWQWYNQRHATSESEMWVWIPGRYVQARQGHRWTDGRWDHNERGHFWIDGRWDKDNDRNRNDEHRDDRNRH